jgi:hypothetical protein
MAPARNAVPAAVSRTNAATMKCARRAVQSVVTSSCWRLDCVCLWPSRRTLLTRTEQVDTMLKTQDRPEQVTTIPDIPSISTNSITQQNDTGSPILTPCVDNTFENRFPQFPPRTSSRTETGSWEMIGLGLEEPLPTLDAVNEL